MTQEHIEIFGLYFWQETIVSSTCRLLFQQSDVHGQIYEDSQ